MPVNTPEQPAAESTTTADELLLRWQLDVAVRADELARGAARGKETDLRVWLQAEQEVWERQTCLGAR